MTRILSVCVLAGLSLALGACTMPGVHWSRPVMPAVSYPPVLLHDMAIANPPHPLLLYADYMDEPTRFVFRPRNIIMLEEDNGTGVDETAVDAGAYDAGGGDVAQ